MLIFCLYKNKSGFCKLRFCMWVHLVLFEIAWFVVCWAIFDFLTASNVWHYFFCTFDPRVIFEKWFLCFITMLRYIFDGTYWHSIPKGIIRPACKWRLDGEMMQEDNDYSSSRQATSYSSVDLISIIVGTIAAATLLIAISLALVVLCWKKKVLWYVDNLHFSFCNVLTFLFTI